MSKIIFGDKERQQIYIYNYYFWQSMPIGTLRLFGGPLMIGLAIWFYITEVENPLLFGSILLTYGIYYTIRPFIFVFFNREKLDIGMFEIQVDKNGISIINESGDKTYDFTKFKKIRKYKKWFALYFNSKSILFLPENQLNESEKVILNARL
jgi:hypothetical protein